MAHVHIQHMVAGVCPDDGDIGRVEDVLFAERIVDGVEGHEHFHVFVVPGVGLPAIPFVDGRGKVDG